jgi:type II secretory pathway pseudopilin PulG
MLIKERITFRTRSVSEGKARAGVALAARISDRCEVGNKKPVAYAPGSDNRPSFTLVEMLVVVSILLILTVAVVAVAPRFTDDRKLARAADQLAQILLTAKQRAKRDLIPTGVRLFPDPQHNGLVTQLQFIQQPDDFAVGTVTSTTAAVVPPVSWPTGCNAFVASSSTVDFTGGFSDSSLWPVQVGDYLVVAGTAHLIIGVAAPPTGLVLEPVAPSQPVVGTSGNDVQLINTAQISVGMSAVWSGNPPVRITKVNNTSPTQTITLASAPPPVNTLIGFLPSSVTGTPQPTTYSVIRRPRVLQGETPLQLPASICIDPTAKWPGDTTYPFTLPADIMFTPQGTVQNSNGRDSIILWVRDYTKDVSYPAASWPPGGQPGDQFLILVQTHTGFIAEHPVDVGVSGNPYSFTQDARSSGL